MENENKDKAQNQLLLTSIYQNVQTALQSLDNIMKTVKCDALAAEISKQEGEYNIISEECEMIAKSEDIDIKDNNMFEKIRLWGSIKISTLSDKSTTHIAQPLATLPWGETSLLHIRTPPITTSRYSSQTMNCT